VVGGFGTTGFTLEIKLLETRLEVEETTELWDVFVGTLEVAAKTEVGTKIKLNKLKIVKKALFFGENICIKL